MAAYGWGTDRALKDLLFMSGHRFEFYQAVRLLEQLCPEKKSIAEGSEPEKEAIRFRSKSDFNFPACDIHEIRKPLFCLSDRAVNALRREKLAESLLDKLNFLKNKFYVSESSFSDAVQAVLGKDQGAGYGPLILKHADLSADSENPFEMSVNFMGLAGCLGPLPKPYTELILNRVREKDTAFRDFLDIFNHRLISLIYRVRKIYRIGFDLHSPEKSRFSDYLFSFMGMGTKGLRGRMKVKDRALLFYTGLLTQQPRSMTGLKAVISDYFNVRVQGNQLCGQWHAIDEDQLSRIGSSGQNRRLGIDTVAGSRVWDQQSKFELEIGPLTFEELYDFLPEVGTAFVPLYELTRFYAGTEFDFDFILLVSPDKDIEPRLGRPKGPILGRTSWLKRTKPDVEYERVRLAGRLG